MYISHIFFIHSSVDGHSGCFHILTNVNNAAMNIRVHSFSQFSHSVVSDSLQHPGLQRARLPWPSQLLELAQTHVHRVGDAIQPCYPLVLMPSIFTSIRVFFNESVLHIRCPK